MGWSANGCFFSRILMMKSRLKMENSNAGGKRSLKNFYYAK